MASRKTKSSGSGFSTRRRENGNGSVLVVCVANDGYPAALELHKIYRVLTDDGAERDDDLRLIDESGEDYLYPSKWLVSKMVPQAVKSSLLRAS